MVEPTPAVIVVERHDQRLDRYALSLAYAGHFLADFDYLGRKFMTEDLRQRGTREMMRVHRGDDRAGGVFMKIGSADAADLGFHDDLPRPEAGRLLDLFHADIFLAVIANCFHVSLPSLPRRVALSDPQAPVPDSPRSSDSGAPAQCRIDERCDDDEHALERILVGLGKPQKRHGVQDLGQQHGAQHRADECSPSAAQARPAEDYGGFAGQRVGYSLSRDPDPDL